MSRIVSPPLKGFCVGGIVFIRKTRGWQES